MRTSLAVVTVAILTAGGCASDERFPSAPILLVCPWTAGGGSDRVARQLAVLLEQDLDVPVNVINVTGGDGVTGHSRGALARPDGYTMTLVTVEIATLHWRQMTSIRHHDFAPIGLVNRDAAAVFVRSDAPWQTLGDLEQAIRAAPGTLRGSGTATAGIWLLALAEESAGPLSASSRGRPGEGRRLWLFIAHKLGVDQPTASEHLRILVQAGLLKAKRIKQWTFCARDEKRIDVAKKQFEKGWEPMAALASALSTPI